MKTIKEAYEKGRLVLYNPDGFSLMLKIYYTIIFKEENISFELHKKSEDEEENKRLIGEFYSGSDSVVGKTDLRFKADLIGYKKKFEEYKETSFIKIRVKNIGTCTWDRKLTSFKCVHEYSTLICNDYILERDVIPDTEEEIELEFMKKNPNNIDSQRYTSLQLNYYDLGYEPLLFLDFDDAFKDDEIKKDSEEEENNKINIIKEEKKEENENKNEIIIHKEEKSFNEDDLKINLNNNNNLINEEKKDEIKINLDEENKSKIIFDNVKVNINFNIENMNKIIYIDVNENKVKFNVDKNTIKFIDSKENKIKVEEKKPPKQIKKLKENDDNNKINEINQGKKKNSVFDRAKFFEKK